MQTTMKAAVVRSFGKPLVIEDVPVPTPGPGEVLVKVKACGVCHTDLHAASGDWPVKPTPPFIPGHEAAGVVAAGTVEARLLIAGNGPAARRQAGPHAPSGYCCSLNSCQRFSIVSALSFHHLAFESHCTFLFSL